MSKLFAGHFFVLSISWSPALCVCVAAACGASATSEKHVPGFWELDLVDLGDGTVQNSLFHHQTVLEQCEINCSNTSRNHFQKYEFALGICVALFISEELLQLPYHEISALIPI